MFKQLPAVLILLGAMSVAHAQEQPDPFDPGVAISKAWSLLTAALDAADLQEQLAAVSALTIADTPRALDLFERVAQTGTAPVRRTALWYLSSNASRNYLALVAAGLKDSDLSVRRNAIERLAHFRDGRALPLLQDVIAAGDDSTIEYAVGSARNLGSSGIGPLLRGVESANDRAVVASVRTLDVLLDPVFSSAATENLLALRAHRPDVVLAKALQHSDSQVRIFAALIAARLGNDAGTRELIRASESADLKLGTILSVHHAMAALNSLGRDGYLARLSSALHDPEQRVRANAASALTSFPHPSTVSLWSEIWRGTSDLRYRAFEGLIRRQGSLDLKLVREGLRDSDPHIRLRAAEEILAGGLDTEALDVVESLALLPITRIRALDVLNRRGDPQRTATLARSLLPKVLEEDARTRGYDTGYTLAVVHTFEVVRDRDAVQVLGTLFGPDRNLTYRVVQALVAIGGDSARKTLVRAMDSPDGSARALAAGGVIRLYSR
jgi:HEAT repeat protein